MATAILLIFLVMQANAMRIINPNRRTLQEPPLLLPKDRSQHEVKERWLEQRLDHFDENNNQTWQMRYFQNDKYYEAGAPLFIFIGGEWEISKAYLLAGHFYDIALQHHAMLYYVEHRFYGKSIPENDTSLENLKYLNIKQALADLDFFITTQKQSRNSLTNSKVILAGGSYAGSIVAWFQKIYPGLATAGWASSAPLFAKMDFYEYMIIAGESIKRKGGLTCYKRIKTGMEALAEQFKLNASDEILHKLMVCDNFDTMNPLDIEAFFNTVGYYFSEVVQSYSSYIKSMCKKLLSHQSNDAEALTTFLSDMFWLRGTKYDACIDLSYESTKNFFAQDNYGMRQWYYQTCSEFGWYTTTATRYQHPFASQVSLGFFQQLCRDVYNNSFTSDNISSSINQTNAYFGNTINWALDNNYETTFFTHGQLDPWRAVGVQNGNNVIVIPGYAHCADLGSINLNDSVEMNVTKLKVAHFLNRALRTPGN